MTSRKNRGTRKLSPLRTLPLFFASNTQHDFDFAACLPWARLFCKSYCACKMSKSPLSLSRSQFGYLHYQAGPTLLKCEDTLLSIRRSLGAGASPVLFCTPTSFILLPVSSPSLHACQLPRPGNSYFSCPLPRQALHATTKFTELMKQARFPHVRHRPSSATFQSILTILDAVSGQVI